MFLKLEDYMLPCLNKKLLGVDCLGCGFQRAIVHVLKGEFIDAFKMYPAIYSLLFFLIYILLNFKFKFNNSQKTVRFLLLLNLILIVGNFILKIL
ncbi:Protein of unknown function [Tenacibaculum sp. MAR_2010_89]|uniref:DUF2752 domain-containing protein n=1 Tax=Tenacibaculum sp. MAR_2010_89 TaxID=1250198 RepID=UPI000899ECA8|nr:DUF2752 domain-containing protein [Tenacibaculum sp. MAR_2010_89]SEE57061.1 Protein of unknown function [Tenacibaculum sp. MAR_2010_89]